MFPTQVRTIGCCWLADVKARVTLLPSFAATNELEARRGYNGAPNCPVLHLFSREVLAKPGRSPMVTPRCCTDGDCGSSSQHLAGAETSLRGEGEIHRGRACKLDAFLLVAGGVQDSDTRSTSGGGELVRGPETTMPFSSCAKSSP